MARDPYWARPLVRLLEKTKTRLRELVETGQAHVTASEQQTGNALPLQLPVVPVHTSDSTSPAQLTGDTTTTAQSNMNIPHIAVLLVCRNETDEIDLDLPGELKVEFGLEETYAEFRDYLENGDGEDDDDDEDRFPALSQNEILKSYWWKS
jgi:hypothetical protein